MTRGPSLLKSQLAAAAGTSSAAPPAPEAVAAAPAAESAPKALPKPKARAARGRGGQGAGTAAKARVGKTMLAGYFSAEAARAVRILAAEEDVTVQALIGEGIDLVLRKYGKHPFGER